MCLFWGGLTSPSVLLYSGIFPIITFHCGSNEREVRVETVSLCSSTAEPHNNVGRTGPGAAGLIPAFLSFAESTAVPEAELQ